MSWPDRPVIQEVNVWPWLHDIGEREGRAVTLADVKRVAKRLLEGNMLITVVGKPQPAPTTRR